MSGFGGFLFLICELSWYTSPSSLAQWVKNPPAMHETPVIHKTWVLFLSQEVLLDKEMATHSSILAWKIPWTEEPGRLQFIGLQRVGHN